jgi:hypothetical protein
MVLKDQAAFLDLAQVITLDLETGQLAGPPAPKVIGETSLLTRSILNNSS